MINPFKKILQSLIVLLFISSAVVAQNNNEDYLKYSWKKVATQMPDQWYSTADAQRVAETVLFCQQDNGGWQKNKPYHLPLTKQDSSKITGSRSGVGSTIDNGATTTEMIFLAKMNTAGANERYAKAFNRALDFLLEAQYKNGGWPQFYPFRDGKSVSYASHITYNDNAMVNVLQLLRDVAASAKPFNAIPVDAAKKEKAKQAYSKGIECVLNTQIKKNNQLTVWCAQHDEFTLLPANARAYELASFSGSESVGIVYLLMEIENPSQQIITAVTSAVKWMDAHKLTGIKLENKPGADGKRNMLVVQDATAVPLLARFYDLETEQPFFCDRDGIKKPALADIGSERRNGYSWYSDAFPPLQKQYNKWLAKWNVKE
ncbi:MAG: pectate lyase [Lacibacter sp.]